MKWAPTDRPDAEGGRLGNKMSAESDDDVGPALPQGFVAPDLDARDDSGVLGVKRDADDGDAAEAPAKKVKKIKGARNQRTLPARRCFVSRRTTHV
jgi:hypothetical protein